MNLADRLSSFSKLGDKIRSLSDADIQGLASPAKVQNAWFDTRSVAQAFSGVASMLEKEKLEKWTNDYDLNPEVPKIVGIIMAGNIPLVGFHDLMSVLLSGHLAAIKMSSQDSFLITRVIEWIVELEPRFKRNVDIRQRLEEVDAVICTGSDNTARYFEYYFGKYPNVIRKNRTSVAILDGTESNDELAELANDIFSYYGLGCRNVSKIFTPKGYDLTKLFPHFEGHKDIIHHNKYCNNYEYHKAIFLVNRDAHLDTGFLLIRSVDDLVSPISVLYHQEYESRASLNEWIETQKEKIQCIVSKQDIPFGQAQSPEPWDYADGVDTLQFLANLKEPK